MSTQGVILYGPPAVGKDTITSRLQSARPDVSLFQRLKAGPGRTAGYRMTTPKTLDRLRQVGGLIWENTRYGAIYAVDLIGLEEHLAAGVPVLHLGQPEAVAAVPTATPDTRWLVVALSCSWRDAKQRIVARGTDDAEARFRAWHETPRLPTADLRIDTSAVSPSDAADLIAQQV